MNRHIVPSFTVAALVLATHCPAGAQTYITADPVAIIRSGIHADTDQAEPLPGQSGVVCVKLDGGSNARKYYAKIDLTGHNPNTNGPVYIQYDAQVNSPQRQRVVVWSMDQDYPGFSSTITWNNAQANDTNSPSQLLTTGPLTATAYGNFLSTQGGGAGIIHELHNGPWGHMIRSGSVIYLAMSSIENIGNNGLRFVQGSVRLGFEDLITGAPPSLSALPDITVFQGQTSVTNAFTVDDPEDGPNALVPTATSSNAGIVDPANIFFEGTGGDRAVYVVAGNTVGTATVVVSVFDGSGNRATRSFTVTVEQLNLPPVIIAGGQTNLFAPVSTLLDTPVTVPFAVADAESANSELTVTAVIADYSLGILQSAVLEGTDFNTNLSLTVTPQPGVDGVGVVRVSVSDPNGNTTTVGLSVMVRANASIVFVDRFEYQGNNNRITDDAPNFWTRRNAAAQSVLFRSATSIFDGVSKVAHVRPNAGAESVAAPLAGGPYNAASRAVLYTRFTATFSDLTGGNIITNVNGESPFFRLSPGPSMTTDFVNLLAVQDLSDGSSMGSFTFLLANGLPDGPFAQWPDTFGKPFGIGSVTKTFVMRYDVAEARATLWVDAASEADPHISASDAQPVASVGYVGLFQARGNGDIYVDDMTVTLVIKPLITGAAPAGAGLEFDFAAGEADVPASFVVERASTVNGTFTGVGASINALGGGAFRATVAAPGAEGYFRVKRAPVVF